MKHRFLKHALWTATLVAGAALAQDAAISGADFTHGSADAELRAIGSHAAAQGKTVVVTAPPYWQGKVAAKIRAGAHGKPVAIRFSNGFYENVLVRTEAPAPVAPVVQLEAHPAPKPAATKPKASETAAVPAKPRPRAVAKLESGVAEHHIAPSSNSVTVPDTNPSPASIAPVSKITVTEPAPRLPVPTAVPEKHQDTGITAVPQVSQRPAVVPIPTSPINSTGVEPALPQPGTVIDASARQRMLAALNGGRPAAGSLTEGQLQPGDQVYTDGDARAVVRLQGLRRDLYWIHGPLDLQRVQFSPHGTGNYEVTGSIDPRAPATHRNSGTRLVNAIVPATGSAARSRLEQQYNNGQPITATVTPARLQPEDRLLVNGSAIVVARREGNSMTRYWLDGSINLGQNGLQKVATNVYRVTGNNLH